MRLQKGAEHDPDMNGPVCRAIFLFVHSGGARYTRQLSGTVTISVWGPAIFVAGPFDFPFVESGLFVVFAVGQKKPRHRISRRRSFIYAALSVVLAVTIPVVFFWVYAFTVQYGIWKSRQPIVAAPRENSIVQYDPRLGWRHRPEAEDEDLFGPGTGARINRMGARGRREYPRACAQGITRFVCLGDSFMFGHGLRDEETFSAELERQEGVEAINLGVMGYGLDQACLRYMEEGERYEHQVVILGLITDDFRRLLCDRGGCGFYKPRFYLKHGGLELTNVPTPPPLAAGALIFPESRWQFLAMRYPSLRGLMAESVLNRISYELDDPQKSEPLAEALVMELNERCQDMKRKLVVVWFPTLQELREPGVSVFYEEHVKPFTDFTRRHGIALLDLMPVIAAEPKETVENFFLTEEFHHPSSGGQAFFAGKTLDFIRKLK